jgi:hypothetical protein
MKIKNFAVVAPVLSALFLMACGQQNDQNSDLDGFKKKKYYVLACDGFVFDNNDPFGRRVTFAREGSKQFKQTSDFVLANETAEWRNVVANMAGDCINGSNRIQGFVANICGQINAVDPQLRFNTLELAYNNVTYKGSWSCNLKEKSK